MSLVLSAPANAASSEQLYQIWARNQLKDQPAAQKAAAKAAAEYLSASPSGDHAEALRQWLDAYNRVARKHPEFGLPVFAVEAKVAQPPPAPLSVAPATTQNSPETSPPLGHVSDATSPAPAKSSPIQTTTTIAAEATPAPVAKALSAPAPAEEAGKPFQDCPQCPQMLPLPTGTYLMGSPESEYGRSSSEGPQHRVTISKAIAMSAYDVTFDEWKACVSDDGCGEYTPSDENWGSGNRPVINISWDDAQAYIDWLSRRTGKRYRLPSEAEWEFAARATSEAAYFWGNEPNTASAVYGSTNGTSPVGSTPPNRWGLYDMLGNVWQWSADCYHPDYAGAPIDGSSWDSDDCTQRILRGGSWVNNARNVRAASRSWANPIDRFNNGGFRVVRDL